MVPVAAQRVTGPGPGPGAPVRPRATGGQRRAAGPRGTWATPLGHVEAWGSIPHIAAHKRPPRPFVNAVPTDSPEPKKP